MKSFIIFSSLFFITGYIEAQVLKDIGRDIKRDAEWRLNRKVREKADDGIDSLLKLPKKAKEKKQQKKAPQDNSAVPKINNPASLTNDDKKPSEGEGYITLRLSSPVSSKGLFITLGGESIKYDKWKTVDINIKTPDNKPEKLTLTLADSGKYKIRYDLLQDGEYIFTATSSDGKADTSQRLWAGDVYQPDDGIKDLMDVTGEAFNRLKQKADAVKPIISTKNAALLDTKVDEAKKNLDALHKLMNSLNNARKEIGNLYKAGKRPSENIRENMSQLNDMVAAKSTEVKQIKKMTEHEPADNSVCEYLVMLNEACAAFSTFTNFWAKSLGGIIKNIILDKAIPKSAEITTPLIISENKSAGDAVVWGKKEAAKIFATAEYDAKGLNSRLGQAGLAGDVIQFASEVLLKAHCGIYKGKLTHHYTIIYRNDEKKTWWDYSVESEAAITLRYPKTTSGGIIKMKGNIEGNAVRFEFFADPNENPGYKEATGGRIPVSIIKNYTPFALPAASSLHDELGFGMVARGLVTPAYFNIPIDAEYNTGTEKIKIFINPALIDFNTTPFVYNRQFFIQWAAGLPKLRMMDYPISNARLTINASLKDKTEFDMKKDAKGNLSFGGKIKRHIGSKTDEREHFLGITIALKKEN